MLFGDDWKVKIETLTLVEAKIFILFLETEIARHQWDIENAKELIKKVKDKFSLK